MPVSTQTHSQPTLIAAFRAVLARWGFDKMFSEAAAVVAPVGLSVLVEGRRPGAGQPVYIEVSPAVVEPFPEPRTIPGGWDLSELVKQSKQG
jgi:hypothetical protein